MAARKFVIIAPTNQEANEWVSAINACCSFKEDFVRQSLFFSLYCIIFFVLINTEAVSTSRVS